MLNEIVLGGSVKMNVDTYLNIYVVEFGCMSGVFCMIVVVVVVLPAVRLSFERR